MRRGTLDSSPVPVNETPPPDPASATPGQGTAAPEGAAGYLGRVISDRYRIVELIATGGMGAVYKAEHLLLRKWVAVKLLHPQTKNLPEQVLRFEREAIAGAHLQHPNIAAATDFGKLPDGSFFLVLEYVRGIPLEDLIKRGPIPPARTVKIARQIAAALSAAHERGVIHRDVKPHNIMMDPAHGDLVKLIDFGLAKVPLERFETTDRDSAGRGINRAITQRDMVFGTVAYMAPEAAGGMDKVDERSDLYALGIIIYEMLAGMHPFDATERLELFRAQCTTPPPPLKLRNPSVDVPRELEAVVMRLLRKEPAQRFESARHVNDALDDALPALIGRAGSSPYLDAWRDPLGDARVSRPDTGELAGAAPPPPASPASPASGNRASPISPPAAMSLPMTPAAPRSAVSPASPVSIAWRETQRKSKLSLKIGAGVAVAAAAILGFVLLRSPTPDAAANANQGAGASTAPTASATAAPTTPAVAPQDRDRLIDAARYKEWSSGEEVLVRLIQTDPAAFRGREVQKAAASIAVRIAYRADARADQVFEALEKRLGADGLDVLYEMVSAHGGTKGADRAMEILRRPDVLGRLGAPLKIAVELRDASCKKKPELFDRAAREGDERAAVVLELLRAPQCKPKIGQCCFQEPALERAITSLRARLRTQPQ